MVVAVSRVVMMQPAVDQVIRVIAVRHCFVFAISVMRTPAARLLALRRVLVADLDTAFIDMRVMHFMQMPVMQKIGMIAVFYLRVPAICAVRVRVIFMGRMCHKIR